MAVPPRGVVVLITALAIYVPLSFIIIQSFLSAPFFSPSKVFSLDAFRFIFADSDFYKALKSGFIRPSAWPPSPFRWEACWPS